MIEFEYSCGFWFVRQDGVKIANTGCDWIDKVRASGIKINHVSMTERKALAIFLGKEYEEAENELAKKEHKEWLAKQTRTKKVRR